MSERGAPIAGHKVHDTISHTVPVHYGRGKWEQHVPSRLEPCAGPSAEREELESSEDGKMGAESGRRVGVSEEGEKSGRKEEGGRREERDQVLIGVIIFIQTKTK